MYYSFLNCSVRLNNFVTITFLVSSKVPSPPENVKMTTLDCGRAITVEWKPSAEPNINGYQIKLTSLKESILQFFNLSSDVHSKQLTVRSNVVYEVHIRAQNYAGFSLWKRQQLTTTAGK